jgi:hypothetical protein
MAEREISAAAMTRSRLANALRFLQSYTTPPGSCGYKVFGAVRDRPNELLKTRQEPTGICPLLRTRGCFSRAIRRTISRSHLARTLARPAFLI